MAVPRVPWPSATGVSLPQPLTPGDAARLRHAWALQARGQSREAAREAAALDDTLLLGPLLADRYLGRSYRSSPDELTGWLARFGDQPDAPAIHALLARRMPKGAVPPPAPTLDSLAATAPETRVPEEIDGSGHPFARNALLDRTVLERAREGQTKSAIRLIDASRLRPAYAALLRGEVAQVLFAQNEDEQALAVASAAAHCTPLDEQVALPGFVAGLAAWRLDRPELAVPYFEAAARAPFNSAALRSAAAFWAARAHLHTGDPGGFPPWMKRAAAEPRTLHGILARRMLGIGGGFAWTRETLSTADVEAVGNMAGGARAFALLQIGQPDRAEAELRALWPAVKDAWPLRDALLRVAREAGFTDLAAQIAAAGQAADGRPRDFDRFPVPRLRPRGGFRVDPALVYALTRLESNFDAEAVSPVGARGLMQLMPETAGYIAGEGVSGERLRDPAVNLDLGQRYVSHLATLDVVGGDLLRLLASYNAGPGNVGQWAMRDRDDPLLYIEAIPLRETRAFVQRALTYAWIYAARLRLPSPSLDQMAAGAFPRFTPPAKAETGVDAAWRVR